MFYSLVFYGQKIEPGGVNFEATYLSDVVTNCCGGIRSGCTYLGLIDLSASVNTKASNLWVGGEFMLRMQNTHGGSPSKDLVGDLQMCNNSDNGEHTYLYELWYKQTIGDFSFLIGKHDLNSEFLTSDYGAEYINSSLGIMPIASANIPVSIFPKTGLGVVLKYNLAEALSVQTSLYDGDPLDLETDPYGVNFETNRNDGYASFSEIQVTTSISSLPGTYKLSYFFHTGKFSGIADTTITYGGNWGVAVIADQMLYNEKESNNQGLGVLLQCGVAPYDRNLIDFYLAIGLNYYGLIPGRDKDFCGISMAHASLSSFVVESDTNKRLRHETTFELTYSAALGNNILLKPDVQYIIQPGANPLLSNTIVGILRFQISF